MKLKNLLSEKRTAILKGWVDVILETYPSDAANFIKRQKNQFANPVGHSISEGTEKIFDGLLRDMDVESLAPFLDNIIRVRAVQGFAPSEAMAFIFLLKKVIRDMLERDLADNSVSQELVTLESRIDALALSSFDMYMKCREKIYEIKANESKRMTFRLLQRANLICGLEEQDPELTNSNTNNVK